MTRANGRTRARRRRNRWSRNSSTRGCMRPSPRCRVEQKEALVLQQFSGMSILEIAVVTGAEAETVKSRLRYAMQKLRAGLDSAAGAGGQA